MPKKMSPEDLEKAFQDFTGSEECKFIDIR
jgi:putative ribosome biogenesis GTPase RsgA